MSKYEIERLIAEAEKYKTEDQLERERCIAKNNLESYCVSMKQTAMVSFDNLPSKISSDDIKSVFKVCDSALKWLDSNQIAMRNEFEQKTKEVEMACSTIVAELLNAQAAEDSGIKIEEID